MGALQAAQSFRKLLATRAARARRTSASSCRLGRPGSNSPKSFFASVRLGQACSAMIRSSCSSRSEKERGPLLSVLPLKEHARGKAGIPALHELFPAASCLTLYLTSSSAVLASSRALCPTVGSPVCTNCGSEIFGEGLRLGAVGGQADLAQYVFGQVAEGVADGATGGVREELRAKSKLSTSRVKRDSLEGQRVSALLPYR